MIDAPLQVLLRVCADPDADHSAALARLDPRQWARLVDLGTGVDVAPLLARAAAARIAAQPENEASLTLSRSDREARMETLRQSAGLVRACARLEAAGHAPVVLKGAGVARLFYPAPHLRPMVDIDLLMADAESAQRALLETGEFTVHPEMRDQVWRNPEHLVPLVDKATNVTFELHRTIGSATGSDALAQAVSAQAVTRHWGGSTLRVPPAVLSLAHLVANAALKDRMVGKLVVLSDCHYAMRSGEIDPDELRCTLAQFGLTRPFAVIRAVARRAGAQWTESLAPDGPEVPVQMIDDAARMLAVSRAAARSQRLIERAGGSHTPRPMVLQLARRAFAPDPLAIAAIARRIGPGTSRARAYIAWLADRAGTAGRAVLERRQLGIGHADRLAAWMREVTPRNTNDPA